MIISVNYVQETKGTDVLTKSKTEKMENNVVRMMN